MKAWLDNEGMQLWTDRLYEFYDNDREFDTENVHVSDLTSCLRRPVLSAQFDSNFEERTLWMFTLGRAFENSVFQYILGGCECGCHKGEECRAPGAGLLAKLGLQAEMEVIEGGLQGHIDFGGVEYDVETKCTWKRQPKSDSEVQDFFDRSPYWVDQAATYAVMRRRTQSRFLVLHIATFPFCELGLYGVEWTPDELRDHWDMMQNRRSYVVDRVATDRLPMKTLETQLCKSCQVLDACEMAGD